MNIVMQEREVRNVDTESEQQICEVANEVSNGINEGR